MTGMARRVGAHRAHIYGAVTHVAQFARPPARGRLVAAPCQRAATTASRQRLLTAAQPAFGAAYQCAEQHTQVIYERFMALSM